MIAGRERSGVRLICIVLEKRPRTRRGEAISARPKPTLHTTRKTPCHATVRLSEVADDTYKSILNRADAFFRSVMDSQPKNLQCGRGCSLCCYGLFEIGSADVPIIADGLAKLHPQRRAMIIRRAVEIIASRPHPNLHKYSPLQNQKFFYPTP